MTVSTTDAFVQYVGDGSTVEFTFEFPSFEVDWMFGLVDRVQVPGSAVLNVDQSANPGGVFTFSNAPEDQTEVTILRLADFLQLTDYPPFTKFPAESHEKALDKSVMVQQQLAYSIALLEGDATRFVLRSGDQMTGSLSLSPAINLYNVDDFVPKKYIDLEDEQTRNTLLAAIQAVENRKADKSVEIVTNDPQTLIIADPSLSGDVTITTRTNSQEALIKTNQVGLIPPEHIPPLQGGILTIIGLLDASLGITPPDPIVSETGLAYIIIATGTITIRTFSDTSEQPVLVEITDNIVWIDGDNVPGLPQGWYFLPLSQVPTIATSVITDDALFPYVATNVQETFDRLFDTFLGTCAPLDVQLDATDNDLNRVLRVGGFGLGSTTSATLPDDDLDTVFITGFYRITADATNTPPGATVNGSNLIVTGYDGSAVKQIYIEHAVIPRMFLRRRDAGTWGVWRQFVMDGDSPTFDELTTTGTAILNTLETIGGAQFGGGSVRFINPEDTQFSGRIRMNNVVGREQLQLMSTGGTTNSSFINIFGPEDSVNPNQIGILTDGSNKIVVTSTEPQCIDKAGTLRRMNHSPVRIDVGTITLNDSHIGHTLYTGGGGAISIPPNVGATGDLVQVVTGGSSATITPTGGTTLSWRNADGGATGSRTIALASVATLWQLNSDTWYIWGNGIS